MISVRPVFLMMLGLASFLSTVSAAGEGTARQRLDFNAGWSFHKGDPEGLGDQLAYSKIKDRLLASANAFARTPAPVPKEDFVTTADYAQPGFDDSAWRKLDLPHDWGIEGPFKQEYPGETGKLPWWGVAWYRKSFDLPAGGAAATDERVYLDVDGAMSYATVWCNGRLAGGWPYGYSSFRVDLTPFLRAGARNTLAIRLDNPPDSSRWYPGGGIYRKVWLVKTPAIHVAQWGTKITTPEVGPDVATIKIETTIDNHGADKAELEVLTQLYLLVENPRAGTFSRGQSPCDIVSTATIEPGQSATVSQPLLVTQPQLWSLAAPHRYVAVTQLRQGGKVIDEYETPFGIRKIEFTPGQGFRLNGERVPLNGVCMHHDLGALGAAFNVRAAERQLQILKEMGANALRTTHNPAAPELLELCDRLGMLVIGESFDCWHWGKTPNDYALLFNDWSERDLRAQIRRDRNHPSLILWSVGNEIVNVEHPENAEIAKRLVAIVHEEDRTRGATAGVNNTPTGFNGYQKIFDVFGFNYRSMFYQKFREATPELPVYGSETASTVSSRGEYFFPVTEPKGGGMEKFQMSSYDLYAPRWAWPPDAEFKWLDETPATLGEFVWTGFDYLGEPTPYTDDWSNLMNIQDPEQKEKLRAELEAMSKLGPPSRSSYFGIVDLAGFKKDRFYLYQARWRPELPLAHILPHWNWPEREGQVTPVHVYTSGDEAELFLNGVSLGRKKRGPLEYRFRWNEVTYAPGELKVVAYKNGQPWAEDTVHTTGPAAKIALQADRSALRADGLDLAFVTVSLTDKEGRTVPTASHPVAFEVSGAAELVATDNGDATSHVSFQSKQRSAYHGLVLAILRTKRGTPGPIRLQATAEGLESAEIVLQSAAP